MHYKGNQKYTETKKRRKKKTYAREKKQNETKKYSNKL